VTGRAVATAASSPIARWALWSSSTRAVPGPTPTVTAPVPSRTATGCPPPDAFTAPFPSGAIGEYEGMFPAENLRDWHGENVIDPDGNKIGELESVYVDTVNDEPAFATVRVGIIGRHRLVFVPLLGATVTPKAVRVRYDKKLANDAPSIDVNGELAATDEPAVFAHYNLSYQPGVSGARRLARR
jgi:hypothetical protein